MAMNDNISSESFILSALGMVNALGNNAQEIWAQMRSEQKSFLVEESGYIPNRKVWVGKVRGSLPKIPNHLDQFRCRNNVLALCALQQIELDVRAACEKFGAGRVGVVMATSTSGADSMEAAYQQWAQQGTVPSEYAYVQQEMGGLASFCAAYFGILGPAYTISTACSSGAKVFSSAQALIRMGICDAVVVGGADSLCRMTLQGFNALQSLSEKICNPLSRNRDGLNIGEGAAIFLLLRGQEGVRLLGVGESVDAHHLSAPDPEGLGAFRSMSDALGNRNSSSVNYINLHGTATVLNDRMECVAIEKLFPGGNVPVSSTKPFVGHALGAAGAIEIGFCWLAFQYAENKRVFLPPHLWDAERDPQIPFVSVVEKNQNLPARGSLLFLSNSFGFGGNNCSVLIGKNFDD